MTIAITGASRGLGKALATRLAAAGKHVVTVNRDFGDLSEMTEVRRISNEIISRYPDLNVLINNAGVSKFTRQVTRDGLEKTFATNYMAPFLLSNLLLKTLARNRPARVLNISSEQHRWVRAIPWDDLQAERHFDPIQQYSLTKLYEILFTRELAERTRDLGIAVNAVSPGFLRTDLGREARGAFRIFLTLVRPFQQPAEAGAEAVTQVLASTETGAYFRGPKQIEPSKLAQDREASRRLWEISLRLAQLELSPAG